MYSGGLYQLPQKKTVISATILILIMLFSAMNPVLTNNLQNQSSTTNSGTVTGFVYDEIQGVPLAGALVFVIIPTNNGTQMISTSSDWIGHYRLEDVPTGITTVTASTSGYSDSSLSINVEEWSRLDFTMSSSFLFNSHTVEGIVQEANTVLPMDGAKITLKNIDNGQEMEEHANEIGEFEFNDVEEGNYEITASYPDYISISQSFVMNSSYVVEFNLKVENPATIGGFIKGSKGDTTSAPISGALVTLVGLHDGDAVWGPVKAITDANGRYDIGNLPPLEYELDARALGYNVFNSILTLNPADVAQLNIDLSLMSATIEIDVFSSIYSPSMPLEGITVQLSGLDGTPGENISMTRNTDSGGAVTFSNLVPPGTYELSISNPAITIDDIDLEFGSWVVTIAELMPNETLQLDVDLAPILGEIVGNVKSKSELLIGASLKRTGQDFMPVPGGGQLSFNCTADEMEFIMTGDEFQIICPSLPNFKNVEAATIRILSSSLDGYEINYGQSEIFSGENEGSGDFSFGLPPGHYELEFSKDELLSTTLDVDVNSDQEQIVVGTDSVSQQLNAVYLIPDWSYVVVYLEKVVAEDSSGSCQQFGSERLKPLSNTAVSLEGSNGTNYSSNTNEFGIVIFERVFSGNYSLIVDDGTYYHDENFAINSGGNILAIKRDITANQTATLGASWTRTDDNGNNGMDVLLILLENSRKTELRFDSSGSVQCLVPFGNYTIYWSYPILGGVADGQWWKYQWDASQVTDLTVGITDHIDTTNVNQPVLDTLTANNVASFSNIDYFEVEGTILDRDRLTPLSNVAVEMTVNYCHKVPNGNTCYSTTVSDTTDHFGNYNVGIYPTSNSEISDGKWWIPSVWLNATKPLYETISLRESNFSSLSVGNNRIDEVMSSSGGLRGTVKGDDVDPLPPSTEVKITIRSQSTSSGDGFYNFDSVKPGLATLSAEAVGYYPFEIELNIEKGVFTEYEIVMEKIPPAQFPDENILLTSKLDGREIGGFIVIGINGGDLTQGDWSIFVKRGELKDGFKDPITSVDLIVRIKTENGALQQCESPSPTLVFTDQGEQGTGAMSEYWGGDIDLDRELPCGLLEYSFIARTAHGTIKQTSWIVFPVKPSLPVNLFGLFSLGTELWEPLGYITQGHSQYATTMSVDTDFFYAKMGSLQVNRKSEFNSRLKYEFFGDFALGAKLGSKSSHPLAEHLSEDQFIGAKFEVKFTSMSLDGSTGIFTFSASSTSELCVKITQGSALSLDEIGAEGCLTHSYGGSYIAIRGLDNPAPPETTVSETGAITETIGGKYKAWITKEIPWKCGFPPADAVLKGAQVGFGQLGLGTTATLTFIYEISASWKLELVGGLNDLMILLSRTLQDTLIQISMGVGLNFKITLGQHSSKQLIQMGLEASVTGMIGADIGIDIADMTLRVEKIDFKAFADLKAFAGIGPFGYSHKIKTPEFTVILYQRGTDSTVEIIPIFKEFELTHLTTDALNNYTKLGWDLSEERIAQGSSTSISSSNTGIGYLATTSLNDENLLTPYITNYDHTTQSWTPLETPIETLSGHAGVDPKLVKLSDDRIMVVWTAVENLDNDMPYSGLLALSESKLKFSIYNENTNNWEQSGIIPNVIPGAAINPIVKSGVGGSLLVWTIDRDGNLFTDDDRQLFYSLYDGANWSNPNPIDNSVGEILEMDLIFSGKYAMLAYSVRGGLQETNTTVTTRVFDVDGLDWGPSINLTNGDEEDIEITISAQGDGMFSLSWVRNTSQNGVLSSSIISSNYDSGVWSPTTEVHTSGVISGLDSTNTIEGYRILTWSEYNDSNHSILAKTSDNNYWDSAVVELSNGSGVVNGIHASMNIRTQEIQATYTVLDGQENSTYNSIIRFSSSEVTMPSRVIETIDIGNPIIQGCTNESAINYNSEATVDDDSCEFIEIPKGFVLGCTNKNATNFDPNATKDDGTCKFKNTGGVDPTLPNWIMILIGAVFVVLLLVPIIIVLRNKRMSERRIR